MAYLASLAPGFSPWAISAAGRQLVATADECRSAPCPPGVPGSIGVATAAGDKLVLVRAPQPAPAPTPTAAVPSGDPFSTATPTPAPAPVEVSTVVLTFEGSGPPVTLTRSASGRTWQVQPAERSPTVVSRRLGTDDVLRLPGIPPSARWSAVVDGKVAPAQGTAAVVPLGRPRDALRRQPAQWLAGGVLLAIVVALHAGYRASRRSLRNGIRALAFAGLATLGAPAVLRRVSAQMPDAPDSLTLALVVGSLAAFAVAAALGWVLTARVPAATTPSRSLRLTTAATAVVLVAVIGYVGELAASRLFPGLGS